MAREVTTPGVAELGRQYAGTLAGLLGNGWAAEGHRVAGPNMVEINALTNEVRWLDLAPDDERREARSITLPNGTSIGAVVAIARALGDVWRDA